MTDILVLDDNAGLITLLQIRLERRGFRVMVGRNGEDGLALLASADSLPAAILSNLYMPRMDGLTFLQHLGENPLWVTIPVVMMTAAPTDETRTQALERGVKAFLQKPFSFDDLDALLLNLGISPN